MDEKTEAHRIVLDSRNHITVTGVDSVNSFDDESITLQVKNGRLTIEGTGLHITELSLDSGKVAADGDVNALYYDDREAGKKNGFFRRKA